MDVKKNQEFNTELANVNAINALLLNELDTANHTPLIDVFSDAAYSLNSKKLTSFANKYHIIKDNEKIVLSHQSAFIENPEFGPYTVSGVELDGFMLTALLDFETSNIYNYDLVYSGIHAMLSSFRESAENGFYLVSDTDIRVIYKGDVTSLLVAYLYWKNIKIFLLKNHSSI